VYRTSDNKTIKSINYSPANLAEIVFDRGATHKTQAETQHQARGAG
jgi:hypothetical protein